ncbi:hypothetical protein OW751_18440 [Klebsiella pneumoniae]
MGLRSATAPAVGRGVTSPPACLFLTEAGEEKIFISGLEKRALDIILYSGQAMLAFMLSF